MARRPVARRLLLGSARVLLGIAGAAWASPACYAGSSGTSPPPSNFYYPVGLGVSNGGNVLYVVNSDFDLQWNGGTLQSYDLFMVRRHAAELVTANETGNAPVDGICPSSGASAHPGCIPLIAGYPSPQTSAGTWSTCFGISNAAPPQMSDGTRVFLNQGCAPPVDSSNPVYFKDSAILGAFATDLRMAESDVPGFPTGTRMFVPVRGDGAVTWAALTPDTALQAPPGDPTATSPPTAISPSSWGPFQFDCGQGTAPTGSRCAAHESGNDSNEPGDTRNVTLPGEPFGIALTEDGTAMAITHQSTGNTSLLLTGFAQSTDQPPANENHPTDAACDPATGVCNPSMQFVVDNLPSGGNGIVAVPHDPDAVVRCELNGDQPPCVKQAFLQTYHLAAEVDLLRYFDDDGSGLHRPYLERELPYSVNTNSPGTDQRGIVIDPTPSLVCKAQLARQSPPVMCDRAPGQPRSAACVACGQRPSRVFIASRAPSSVIYGYVGQPSANGDGTFDPDQLVLQGNVPLLPGPSRIYLAPIVDATGHLALRLFVVCYDSAVVFVFDPEDIALRGSTAVPEAEIYVGAGPFAMAFDPFTFQQVAEQEADEKIMGTDVVVLPDMRQDPRLGLKTYRFGYLASFMNSYLQVIDLDDSLKTPSGAPSQQTFEQVVYTLGQLTSPKGT